MLRRVLGELNFDSDSDGGGEEATSALLFCLLSSSRNGLLFTTPNNLQELSRGVEMLVTALFGGGGGAGGYPATISTVQLNKHSKLSDLFDSLTVGDDPSVACHPRDDTSFKSTIAQLTLNTGVDILPRKRRDNLSISTVSSTSNAVNAKHVATLTNANSSSNGQCILLVEISQDFVDLSLFLEMSQVVLGQGYFLRDDHRSGATMHSLPANLLLIFIASKMPEGLADCVFYSVHVETPSDLSVPISSVNRKSALISPKEIADLKSQISTIHTSPSVSSYTRDFLMLLRRHPHLVSNSWKSSLSLKVAQDLKLAMKICAVLVFGEDFVRAECLDFVAGNVLAHRFSNNDLPTNEAEHLIMDILRATYKDF